MEINLTKPEIKPQFKPYLVYVESRNGVKDFAMLTQLSYGITVQLLTKNPLDDELEPYIPSATKSEASSFGMGDVDSVAHMKCGWLRLPEYAKACDIPIQEVEELACQGKLGLVKTHPSDGSEVVVWPPEMQAGHEAELPEPGKYSFHVEQTVSAGVSLELEPENLADFDNIQKTFLALAHSVGKPDAVSEQTQRMLYESCFLLQWTLFEVFIRRTVEELIKQYPCIVATGKKGETSRLTYAEILDWTNAFTSVEKLRDSIIEKEISGRDPQGSSSVHNLINFLKDQFIWHSDPYDAWYVFEGDQRRTHYLKLMEIKDARNALVHDGGYVPESFFAQYPAIPREENRIVITGDYYTEADLLISSIAFSIANQIDGVRLANPRTEGS